MLTRVLVGRKDSSTQQRTASFLALRIAGRSRVVQGLVRTSLRTGVGSFPPRPKQRPGLSSAAGRALPATRGDVPLDPRSTPSGLANKMREYVDPRVTTDPAAVLRTDGAYSGLSVQYLRTARPDSSSPNPTVIPHGLAHPNHLGQPRRLRAVSPPRDRSPPPHRPHATTARPARFLCYVHVRARGTGAYGGWIVYGKVPIATVLTCAMEREGHTVRSSTASSIDRTAGV